MTHDDTVLVVPRTRLFQNNFEHSQDYANDIDVLDDAPSARLERLMRTLYLNNVMNGLIRMSALRRTCLIETFHSGDVVLMGHLVLLGKFRLIDERLFYRRMEAATATALQDKVAVRKHHYPQLGTRSLFQFSKCQLGWIRAVSAARMPIGERLRCLVYVAKRCFWERNLFLADIHGIWQHLIR